MAIVGGDVGIAAWPGIPPGATMAHQIQRLELAGEVVRLVEGCGSSCLQTNPGQSTTHRNQRQHRIDGDHWSFGFDVAAQCRKVGKEQKLNLAPFGRRRSGPGY